MWTRCTGHDTSSVFMFPCDSLSRDRTSPLIWEIWGKGCMEDFVLLEMCFVSPKLSQNEKLKKKKIFFPPNFSLHPKSRFLYLITSPCFHLVRGSAIVVLFFSFWFFFINGRIHQNRTHRLVCVVFVCVSDPCAREPVYTGFSDNVVSSDR